MAFEPKDLSAGVVVERDDQVATITVNRPEALNAVNTEVLMKLKSAFEAMQGSADVRVVIVTGAGEKSFVAGADISEMLRMTPEEAGRFSRLGQEVFGLIQSIPKPVIAAVNGYALGGGMELALACDIRIASETAKFGQPEVGLGIIPGFGGTQRLSRLVGEGRAKDLIFTGRTITAREAFEMGLVEYLVGPGEALTFARKIASQIREKSPCALRHAKIAINRGLELSLHGGLRVESEEFGACFAEPDRSEGIQAFLEKRKPRYQERRDSTATERL